MPEMPQETKVKPLIERMVAGRQLSSIDAGKAIRLNGKPATIIGVMPQGFAFPTNEQVWIPLYSEFPPRPRNDPQANSPAADLRASFLRTRSSRVTRSSILTRTPALERQRHRRLQTRAGPSAIRVD